MATSTTESVKSFATETTDSAATSTRSKSPPMKEYEDSIIDPIPPNYRFCVAGILIFSLLISGSFLAAYLSTSTPSTSNACTHYKYTSCIATNLTLNGSSSCSTRIQFLYGVDNQWDETDHVCQSTPLSAELASQPGSLWVGQIQTCVMDQRHGNALTDTNYPLYCDGNILPMKTGWVYLTFLFSGIFLGLSAAAWTTWMCVKPSYDPVTVQHRDHASACCCIFCVGIAMLLLLLYVTKQLQSVKLAADGFDVNDVYATHVCSIRAIQDIRFYAAPDDHSFGVIYYDVLKENDDDHNELIGVQVIYNITQQDLLAYGEEDENVDVNVVVYDEERNVSIAKMGFLGLGSKQTCYQNTDTAQIIVGSQSSVETSWLNNDIAGISKPFDGLYIAAVFVVCPLVYCCVYLSKKKEIQRTEKFRIESSGKSYVSVLTHSN